MNLICKKQIFMTVLLAENLFLELFTTQNPKFCSYLVSQKPWYGEKMDNKQFLKEKFGKESDFETSFYNASDFESSFSKNVRFSVNLKQLVILESEFLQHVKFWNISFTTRQILVRNFNNATDFYVILVLKNEIFLDILLLKNLSKHVLNQANLKQLVSFWIRTFAACQF